MTTSILIQPEARTVIVGVDTHKHVHVAVAIDTRGIRLGDQSFVADSGGYRALITWADTHGRIKAFGIEGTGSYGAGLPRAVRRAGHRVVEVNRGDRHTRRAIGKSDTVDAESAARSVLAGQATATPKTGDGVVEMIRQLKIARDTAGKARTAAMVTLKQIVVNTPPHLREALHALTDHRLLTRCAALRPGPLDTPTAAAKHTLRALARRWLALAEEIAARPAPHPPHDRGGAHALGGLRCRRPHGRPDADHLRRQPRPDSLRSRLCEAVRGLSDPGFVRDDDRPGIVSIGAGTDKRTPPSIARSSSACGSTSRRSTTSPAGRLAAGPDARSSAASNASSPVKSTSVS